MDARQARRASKSTRDDTAAKAREEKRKEELHVRARRKAGRAEARKEFMPRIRKSIRSATKEGNQHTSVSLTEGMFGANKSDATQAYYAAAVKRLEEILEAEGYKVKGSACRKTYDGGGGSDPLFYGTMTSTFASIEISW